jgi:hypothetical protein
MLWVVYESTKNNKDVQRGSWAVEIFVEGGYSAEFQPSCLIARRCLKMDEGVPRLEAEKLKWLKVSVCTYTESAVCQNWHCCGQISLCGDPECHRRHGIARGCVSSI